MPGAISTIKQAKAGKAARWIAALACLLAALMAIGLALTGAAAGADEQLRIAREGLVPRKATGDIHIVEIDARSIAALKSWPWPREVHARLIDRLEAMGAKTIAFDVDFSAPSTPASDAALAAALDRAGGDVILPTFRQSASGISEAFTENLPIPQLRDRAFLASVNVHPDADGVMRSFTYGTVTQGVARPAMPALLAGVPGKIGDRFPVNTAITPESIPRHSVSDILGGTLPPGALRGKTVIVGATAIELGDRYVMPHHGVRPGVVIQALAAETLLQGLALPDLGPWAAILLALAMLALIARRRRLTVLPAFAAVALLLSLPLALELTGLATMPVAAAAAGLMLGLAVLFGAQAAANYDALRMTDPETGLPNERALRRAAGSASGGFLVVMRVLNFDDVANLMTEEQRRALIEQVCGRVALTAPGAEIFSLGKGRLAWLSGEDDVTRLTESLEGLAALFTARISIGGQKVIVSPAFGIGAGSDRFEPAHADLAASRAAAMGCRWLIYSTELGGVTGRAQQLLADLDEAMAAGEITLVYQPKMHVASGRIESVEALVRWNHATLGPIPPDQFIPMLEDAGRIADLTLYIADRCAETIRRWHKLGMETGVAVNISAPLLSDEAFVATLFARVNALGPLARLLTLEITESAVVQNDAPVVAALAMFRGAGVRIAIDDYGTGQSTLSYLKKFRADEIKIDQSFIRNLAEEPSDQILVRSTIAMAHEMGFKVVAEGVEDEACFRLLADYGCDTVQGWHIGKGVPVEELETRLAAQNAALRAA